VKGIDVKQTEEELTAHANQYNKEIAKNRVLEEQEAAKVQDDEAERLEKSALAREAAVKEVKEEKADRAAGKKAVVDRLASSKLGDVSAAAYTEPTATRKQSSLRRSGPVREAAATSTRPLVTGQRRGATTATTGAAGSLGFHGMKKEASPPAPEAPYDPFGGMEIVTKYYTLQDAYDHQWSDRAKTDPIFTAGGYDVREYYARAQVDAHAGLGVFVGEEMRKRETASVH
jgi:CDK-activating kinase assembly factor MAT1